MSPDHWPSIKRGFQCPLPKAAQPQLTSLSRPDVLFWITIPIVVWLVSLVDLHQRWRRALSPLHIVISSSFGLLLWVVAGGLWFPCTWTAAEYYTVTDVGYCPLNNGDYANGGEPFLVPFIAIGAVVW